MIHVSQGRRDKLTPEEKARNNFGPAYIYVHATHPIAKALLYTQVHDVIPMGLRCSYYGFTVCNYCGFTM
jgi:hypothetical protein